MKTKRMLQGQCESYLNDKYDIKFHFVSTVDDDGWPSHWQHLIYADEEGREVLLKVGTNTLFDNYCSSLYDPEIQKVLSDLFDINGRLFISTASSLFGKNGRYNNYSEYYNSCSFINVFIIVCDQESYEEVRKKMTSIDINKKCFVMLEYVSHSIYKDIDSYQQAEQIPTHQVIKSESFTIENNN